MQESLDGDDAIVIDESQTAGKTRRIGKKTGWFQTEVKKDNTMLKMCL